MKMRFKSLSIILVGAAFVLAACGQPSADIKIAVIPKGTTHEFWEAIHAGAVKAQEELKADGKDVEIIWRGPLKEDDRDQQIQVVETFTTGSVDGIVLAPLDETALVAPIETAVDSGIPVVVIDSGVKTDRYVSFVSTDNHKGGVLAGEHLAKVMGEKGNVVLFRYQVGSASTMEREQGFLEAIAKYPDITVISDSEYGGATRELAYQKAENLLGRTEIRDQIQGVFCPNETVTVAMTKALKDIGKAGGQVKIVGFDTGRQSVLDMENGDLQGLIVQDPIKMGYQGVMTLVDHLEGKKVEKRIDTGVVVITPENMKDEEISKLLNPPIDQYLNR